MSTEISIRPVQPADFTEWKSLWEEFNSHLGRSIDLEITDHRWQSFFDPACRIHAVVAERAGELLGFGHLVFHVSSAQVTETCHLEDIFTRESDRMQGIGRALVEKIVEIAGREGATSVYFQAADDNRIGNELFERISNRQNLSIYRLRPRAGELRGLENSLERPALAVNAAAV